MIRRRSGRGNETIRPDPPGEKVLLEDPSRTVQGKRVTHVVYDVRND